MDDRLSNDEVNRLHDRGFGHVIHKTCDVATWREVSNQPVAFFDSAGKPILEAECRKRDIYYEANDSREVLQRKLLDSETDFFRVMCRGSNRSEFLLVLNKDSTIKELLHKCNRETSSYHGIKFKHVTCDDVNLDNRMKITSLWNFWKIGNPNGEFIINVKMHLGKLKIS